MRQLIVCLATLIAFVGMGAPVRAPQFVGTVAFFGDSIADTTFAPGGIAQGAFRLDIAASHNWRDIGRGLSYANDNWRGAIANSTVEACGDAATNPAIHNWRTRIGHDIPDTLVIEYGYNDWRLSQWRPCYLPPFLQSDMEQIILGARQMGISRIYVLSIPTRADAPNVGKWNAALLGAAQETGCVYVNVTDMGAGDIMADRVHLTAAGSLHLWRDFMRATGA